MPLGPEWTPPGGWGDPVRTDDPVAPAETNGRGQAPSVDELAGILKGEEPFALPLEEFLAVEEEDQEPLLGKRGEVLIPKGGLVLLAGRAGIGKTTLALDLVFHLASGLSWQEILVPRPLRILILENEGPERMFRAKLAAKLEKWTTELAGEIHVQRWRWGWYSFADATARERLEGYCEDHRIDLVVGDPLGTLGMRGVGSPEDTLGFVRLLRTMLNAGVAFFFLHHFRKDPSTEEIDQVQGAWGGHADTLLVLKASQRANEVRLSFPKIKWGDAGGTRRPVILGLVHNTQSFELLGEEGDPKMLEGAITELLEDGTWRTSTEIAVKDSGIGVRRKDVEACLLGNSHLYRSEPGSAHGRSAKARLWQLVPLAGQVGTSSDSGGKGTRPVGGIGTTYLPDGTSSPLDLSEGADEFASEEPDELGWK